MNNTTHSNLPLGRSTKNLPLRRQKQLPHESKFFKTRPSHSILKKETGEGGFAKKALPRI